MILVLLVPHQRKGSGDQSRKRMARGKKNPKISGGHG